MNIRGDVAEHGEVVRVVDDAADVVHLVAVQHLLTLTHIKREGTDTRNIVLFLKKDTSECSV